MEESLVRSSVWIIDWWKWVFERRGFETELQSDGWWRPLLPFSLFVCVALGTITCPFWGLKMYYIESLGIVTCLVPDGLCGYLLLDCRTSPPTLGFSHPRRHTDDCLSVAVLLPSSRGPRGSPLCSKRAGTCGLLPGKPCVFLAVVLMT